MIRESAFQKIKEELGSHTRLVAVSKFKSADDIMALYELGQRDFGENYVQELIDKRDQLPADIHWHFIGHLQTNKVKQIAPFVHLIHGVDSEKLLQEINRQGIRNDRVIDVLLQLHLGAEETKFGLDENELEKLAQQSLSETFSHVRICGLMGMASNTDDQQVILGEYQNLAALFDRLKISVFQERPHFNIKSMGMSGDYHLAMKAGSNMVRIGSLLFGQR